MGSSVPGAASANGSTGIVRRDPSPPLAGGSFAELTVLPHLLRSIAFLAPFVVSLLCWAIGMGLSVIAGLSSVGGQGLNLAPGLDSGLAMLGLTGMVVFGLVWFMSLFLGIREVVVEDGLLVGDAGQGAAAVLAELQGRLERHRPALTVAAATVDQHPALRVSGENEEALIILGQTGPDLRISWTMWRLRSTFTLMIDLLPGRRSNDMAVLRTAMSSTMRDVLRSAIEQSALGASSAA